MLFARYGETCELCGAPFVAGAQGPGCSCVRLRRLEKRRESESSREMRGDSCSMAVVPEFAILLRRSSYRRLRSGSGGYPPLHLLEPGEADEDVSPSFSLFAHPSCTLPCPDESHDQRVRCAGSVAAIFGKRVAVLRSGKKVHVQFRRCRSRVRPGRVDDPCRSLRC